MRIVHTVCLILPLLAGCTCHQHAKGEREQDPTVARLEAPASPRAKPAAAKPVTASIRSFRGIRISIDGTGEPLERVMDQIGQQVGWNILVDPKVQETVTIKLVDIHWRQAVDIIAKMTRCDVTVIRPGQRIRWNN